MHFPIYITYASFKLLQSPYILHRDFTHILNKCHLIFQLPPVAPVKNLVYISQGPTRRDIIYLCKFGNLRRV